MSKKIYNVIQFRHLEKIQKLEKDCFVSPVLKTIKKTNQSKLHWIQEN